MHLPRPAAGELLAHIDGGSRSTSFRYTQRLAGLGIARRSGRRRTRLSQRERAPVLRDGALRRARRRDASRRIWASDGAGGVRLIGMTTSLPAGAHAGLLPDTFALDCPGIAGSLTVLPILAPPGRLEYRSFAEASTQGFVVREIDEPSVNDLVAVNPLDVARPALRGRGGPRGAAGPDVRRERPRAAEGGGRGPGVMRRARALGRVATQGGVHGLARGSVPRTPREEEPAPARGARRSARGAGRPARGLDEIEEAVDRAGAKSSTGAVKDVFRARHHRLRELESVITRHDGQSARSRTSAAS